MRISFFGSSVVSSYWNGACTYYRGLLKEMARPAGFNIDVEVLAYDRYLAQVWNKGAMYVVYYATRPTADAILMKLYHPKEGLDEAFIGMEGGTPEQFTQLDELLETLGAKAAEG